MSRIRVALVGCGYISQAEHLPNLRNNPDLMLVAIVEPHPETAAQAADALTLPVFANLTECLRRTDVDAVLIATPRDSHPALIIEAIEAGKHVLVEKPLAGSVAAARPAVDAAARAGVVVMMGYMRRYESDTLEVQRLLQSGAIGSPVAAITRFQLCYRPVFPSPFAWPLVEDYRETGVRYDGFRNSMLEESIHHINLMRALLGEPNHVLLAEGREDLYQVVWQAGDTLVTHLNLSSLEQGEQVEIYGTSGHLSWRPWSPHFPYTFADLRVFLKDLAEERRPVFPRVNPYQTLLAHFADCIRGEATPRTPLVDGLRDLEMIDRIVERAGESGR